MNGDETHIDSAYSSLDNIVGVIDIILYITTNWIQSIRDRVRNLRSVS